MEITRRNFDQLDGPPAGLASMDLPSPVSRILEQAALISDGEILDTVEAVAKRKWM
ncbi:MAG: hypothetical protein JRE92_09530 [Deltaproteobacteria bacterium]|jgi:pyruvate/2-oxoglutarate/acetoin dehydrogenase E1 component|nr:hypothetical protein [Deltaproteobacteria bacterium]